MTGLLRDLRYAARGLWRTPGFTLGVVLTLALGIGVNATMFGVVDTLFLKPPAGVRDPGRVVRVYVRRTVGSMGTFTGSSTTDRAVHLFDGRVVEEQSAGVAD